MRSVMAGLALVLVASGAGAQEYDPEERALMSEFLTCMRTNAVALDDRASDAATIARGATSRCSAEANRSASYSAFKRKAEAYEGTFRSQLMERGVDMAIAAILDARVKRARPAAPRPVTAPAKPKGQPV